MIFPYLLTPWLPTNCTKPPTLYSILNSIVNYNNENPVSIYKLAESGRHKIFDFEYPLTDKINKKDFEIMILNHFIQRRIGYQTVTSFKIALSVKLNEIMPMYNMLFNSTLDWDLFNDGEEVIRETIDDGTNTLKNNTTIDNTNISDRRNSQMPQNELDDIKNGSYMTDYNYDTNTDNGTTISDSNGTTKNKTNETIKRSPGDKLSLYKEFIRNKQNIYSMIFKDLDNLFYGLY